MLAVLHAGRGQHRPRDDLAAVAERQVLVSRVDGHAGHLERHEQLGAKPLRLRHGAPRQLAAADAGWKPEIVLDPRAAARLPAGRVPIEQQRPQPFRRAVDRRREARRTGADNHEVVEIERGRQRSAEALGHLTWLGVAQRRPILEEQRRQVADADPGRVEQASRVRIARDVEPAIGDEIAREKVLDLVRARRPLVSNQPAVPSPREDTRPARRRADRRSPGTGTPRADPTASRGSDRDARR